MRKLLSLLVGGAVVLFFSGVAVGSDIPEDHASMEGPFESPMDVTAACLECHEDASTEVMATSHWTWSSEQKVPGKGKVTRGKKNTVNNFCISLNSNWPRCTSCHVGYGWKDDKFDFSDQNRVDCLACHDTTGKYFKAKGAPAGSGMPPGFTGNKKFDAKPYDLVAMAQSAGKPTRGSCLNCHAHGGGGNNVKHGDIDRSLYSPDATIDVHMAVEGNNFDCQKCHVTKEHQIAGNASLVSPYGNNPLSCEECHDEEPHKNTKINGVYNKHAEKVACQTCHIPYFAKKYGTKMEWDWSQAKSPKELPENGKVIKRGGHKVYVYKKGAFIYKKKVEPTYAWYNGTSGFYSMGDKINPEETTRLNYPNGSKDDDNSKIAPFKIHKAIQPFDKKNNIIITPKVFGKKGDPDAFWTTFDWKKAAAAGMKANGLEFSGEIGFTETVTYWPTNHMVSPAKKALKCVSCHGKKGRMNWTELGYEDDPKLLAKLKRLKERKNN